MVNYDENLILSHFKMSDSDQIRTHDLFNPKKRDDICQIRTHDLYRTKLTSIHVIDFANFDK